MRQVSSVSQARGVQRLCRMIQVVIALIVVGVLLWLVNSMIPMDAKIKTILNAVVVIAVVLWLLSFFGLLDSDWTRYHHGRL